MFSTVEVSCIHRVGGALKLFSDISLRNFCKKKIVRQIDVRSHVTQDLGDARLFKDICFVDLIMTSSNNFLQ